MKYQLNLNKVKLPAYAWYLQDLYFRYVIERTFSKQYYRVPMFHLVHGTCLWHYVTFCLSLSLSRRPLFVTK